jgi:hypothetical protein
LEANDKKRVLVKLVNEVGIKPSIAAYALLMTAFEGPDAAMLFLVERYDSDYDANHAGKMRHPFIGYFPEDLDVTTKDEAFFALNPIDPEITLQPF